jgi:hypothetical protein
LLLHNNVCHFTQNADVRQSASHFHIRATAASSSRTCTIASASSAQGMRPLKLSLVH